MQFLSLLVLLHLGTTAALLGLLTVVVAGQRARELLRARGHVAAAVPAQRAAQPAREAPVAGASVLEWTVDLRGVGQREAVLRT